MNTNIQAQPTTGLFYTIQQLITDAFDLVFPPRCDHCGRVDANWCDVCLHDLQQTPIDVSVRHDVADIEEVQASGVHLGILQSAIHAFKYSGQPELGDVLGLRLVDVLEQTNWTIDMIVPVPIHTSRLKKRGYNQSTILSDVIAQAKQIPLNPEAITRERDTRAQVGLNRAERLVNVQDAFHATPQVADKTILIVDDVCTTGSTLSACAGAALRQGAKRVYALTIAVAHS